MTRWMFAALAFLACADLAACPLCLGGKPSPAQQLIDLRHAVLAAPAGTAGDLKVIAVIKGTQAPDAILKAPTVLTSAAERVNAKPLLLVRADSWPVWTSLGTIRIEFAEWLRQLAAGKNANERSADEWRARAVLVLPHLEHPEPLVAEIAYAELAAAPYSTMLTAGPRLDPTVLRRWLADPALAARQPLYLLLLGIAGNAQDADGLERRLEAAWKAGDATNLGPLIAADLQLRGPERLAWVDAKYLRDRKRSAREIEAVLLALSVHGNANGPIPRDRVIRSYRAFMQERKEIAGYVAQDLAAWHYWDAVPEYQALLKSDVRQQYASRVAILEYLRQGTRPPVSTSR